MSHLPEYGCCVNYYRGQPGSSEELALLVSLNHSWLICHKQLQHNAKYQMPDRNRASTWKMLYANPRGVDLDVVEKDTVR